MIEKHSLYLDDNPYRQIERVDIYIIDFMDYYKDAIAIGFSHHRALDYAMKSIQEERIEIGIDKTFW